MLIRGGGFVEATLKVMISPKIAAVLSDGIKRNPEKENFAVRPLASRSAHLIHIGDMFNSVTQYACHIW